MVVDHIKDHGQGHVHGKTSTSLFKPLASVGNSALQRIASVIAPVSLSWKLSNRHDLQGGDTRSCSHSGLGMTASKLPSSVKVPTCSS